MQESLTQWTTNILCLGIICLHFKARKEHGFTFSTSEDCKCLLRAPLAPIKNKQSEGGNDVCSFVFLSAGCISIAYGYRLIFVFLLMCLMSVCDVIIQLKYFEQNFDCSYGYDN